MGVVLRLGVAAGLARRNLLSAVDVAGGVVLESVVLHDFARAILPHRPLMAKVLHGVSMATIIRDSSSVMKPVVHYGSLTVMNAMSLETQTIRQSVVPAKIRRR